MSDERLPRTYPRTMASSSKTAVPPRHLTNLMYTLPVRRLKVILSHVVTDATLLSVDELQSTQLARLYTLNMSDERKLLLSLSPSLTVRLLRHESTTLYSEAVLISFITAYQDRGSTSQAGTGALSILPEISQLIPTLLKHSQTNREVGYPYSIFKPTVGVPLSTVSIYLSIPERRIIDTKIGTLARSLAGLTSPSGRFGMVNKVLPDPYTPIVSTLVSKPTGSKTWSEAFNTLLESILRDGEDMAVILPYDAIRAHFRRLAWRFDSVLVPRLILLNLGDEANVMVERAPEPVPPSLAFPAESIKVTGLRSWSQGIFGDPLLSSCFDEPSEAFVDGWRAGGEEILDFDDEGDARGRRLMYGCYGAIVKIVTEYYRPQHDSSRRELEARRRLTSLLGDVEKFDVLAVCEGDRVKRARAETLEEEDRVKRQKLEAEYTDLERE